MGEAGTLLFAALRHSKGIAAISGFAYRAKKVHKMFWGTFSVLTRMSLDGGITWREPMRAQCKLHTERPGP